MTEIRTGRLSVTSTIRVFLYTNQNIRGPGSSVGTATELRAGRSEIQYRWDEIFRPSRPALRPTQPPVKRVLGLSQG